MISIIIPVLNRHDMTIECINRIRECGSELDYEFIIIDNGSDPPFKAPFAGFVPISVIRNDKNEGFPVAINQGIEASTEDIIVVMNNDVFVCEGWLEAMIKYLDPRKIKDVSFNDENRSFIPETNLFSIVGPVTNYCAGLQMVTVGCYNNLDELDERGQEQAGEYANLIEPVNFLIGFCMMFKKSVYEDVGPFDASLWPCSGEEIDFCFKARGKGHKIGIVHEVYVHHEGSQTFTDLESAGLIKYADVCNRNDDHLAKKWGADFWEKQVIEGGIYESSESAMVN